MRQFTEATARNLLRKPLILGVPLPGLMLLTASTLTIVVLGPSTSATEFTALVVGGIGYGCLRVLTRFARPGWEEALLYRLERLTRKKGARGNLEWKSSEEVPLPRDLLEVTDLLRSKDAWAEQIRSLRANEQLVLEALVREQGASLRQIVTKGTVGKDQTPTEALGELSRYSHVASLSVLPVTTDPLWAFSLISRIKPPFRVLVRVEGKDFHSIKRRIEHSRRSNAAGANRITDIDSDVTFEESSRVLQGLSRGDEAVVELALVIASEQPLEGLDPQLFTVEKNPELALLSVTGLRRRFHRSHFVRAVTASDLLPTVADPEEEGTPILKTVRGFPLYFSPQDPRLEALHWLVVGASGSGKSFFTGLVLRRMLRAQVPMSVLFVDHNRSFRRFVRQDGGKYAEPQRLSEASDAILKVLPDLERPGSAVGIELSDLAIEEKKQATHLILSRVEAFLRARSSTHPVYLVLDECWNFMRDEPVLVQRAFREFRKLNGAVVAITQSLSDFITDSTGQSILQNAPIRILLRQGEDLTAFQGALGLNPVELAQVRLLRQVRGEYSECIIKTPFLSRLGRLYPTQEEHELLRTDNLRAELLAEARRLAQAVVRKQESNGQIPSGPRMHRGNRREASCLA